MVAENRKSSQVWYIKAKIIHTSLLWGKNPFIPARKPSWNYNREPTTFKKVRQTYFFYVSAPGRFLLLLNATVF